MTNQIDLDELRRLLAAAPMRPWRAVQGGAWTRLVSDSGLDIASLGFDVPAATRRHAALIAGAINALPSLLAIVEAARFVEGAMNHPVDARGVLPHAPEALQALSAALAALDGEPHP